MAIHEPNKSYIRLMAYNWEMPDWPDFTYDASAVQGQLFRFSEMTGQVNGVLKSLPAGVQTETIIDIIVAEAIKTSEIEGEYLSRKDVWSSVRNNLGLNPKREPVSDKRAAGIGELMIDVRSTYSEPISDEQLFSWHRMLLKASKGIDIGQWRTHEEPMQIISGAVGKEKVHFEAPPSGSVPKEMKRFVKWFNATAPGRKNEILAGPVRAAIAHLYFESIHPFEDGNGRIGRVIAEKALSQSLGRPVLLSLSRTIEAGKNNYYAALKKAQRRNEITPWLSYFTEVIIKAQEAAEQDIEFVLKKSKFFDHFRDVLSERQLKVIRRMLDKGPEGFTGGINATKYGSLTKTSKATATRDLQDLLQKKALRLHGESGGRSTRYEVDL